MNRTLAACCLALSTWALSTLALSAAARPQAATVPVPAAAAALFSFREVMVTMRDGARLQTVIITPRDAKGPLPIMFQRTPYGVPDAAPPRVPKGWASLAADGYVFVFQSMRGRFKSDGEFTLSTAVDLTDPKAVDEASDAYDTIDWLVKNVPNNNGKVGMWGISYPGFAAAVALVRPHPALKAVSPQAAWIDYWQNDDLHRNGALRLSYATDWLYQLQKSKADNAPFPYGQYDTYDWFLRAGSVDDIERNGMKGASPLFRALIEHPNYDSFYTGQRWSDLLGKTTVPTLNVAGYWDQEDPWGSWQIYYKQEQNDPKGLNMIVAGPWSHGYWSRPEANNLGRITYGVPSGQQFLDEVQAPFFRYWLHGRGQRQRFEVKSFQSGSWAWKTYAKWPVATTPTSLYLGADGTLGFTAPADPGQCRSFVSDPAHPVPNRPRPMSPTYPRPEWTWWEAEDQRFVDGRPDVLTWTSAPLAEDLTVTGNIAATLMASTSGTDGDFVVKLIDVLPDDYEPAPAKPANGDYWRSLNGYQLPIAMEVRRGRFLASDSAPQPLVPGKVVAWPFALRDHDHVFKKGHRLMVQVQSSWFPVIDRNPQTFLANPYKAKPGDFVKSTQLVCSGSRVVLPVVR